MIYEEISKCYTACKAYEEAYTINKIAIEKYPYEKNFKENINVLK